MASLMDDEISTWGPKPGQGLTLGRLGAWGEVADIENGYTDDPEAAEASEDEQTLDTRTKLPRFRLVDLDTGDVCAGCSTKAFRGAGTSAGVGAAWGIAVGAGVAAGMIAGVSAAMTGSGAAGAGTGAAIGRVGSGPAMAGAGVSGDMIAGADAIVGADVLAGVDASGVAGAGVGVTARVATCRNAGV
ncbi:MAG: hypothetical protein Q9208_005766 [Pyrenodesmia sp. 3 TL-2023]